MNLAVEMYEMPRSRRTDPSTSKAAAVNATRFASSHAGRILTALEALGTATAHEIAQEAGLTVVQVDRRLCELERAGRAHVITQGCRPLVRDGFRVWAINQ